MRTGYGVQGNGGREDWCTDLALRHDFTGFWSCLHEHEHLHLGDERDEDRAIWLRYPSSE